MEDTRKSLRLVPNAPLSPPPRFDGNVEAFVRVIHSRNPALLLLHTMESIPAGVLSFRSMRRRPMGIKYRKRDANRLNNSGFYTNGLRGRSPSMFHRHGGNVVRFRWSLLFWHLLWKRGKVLQIRYCERSGVARDGKRNLARLE